MRRPFPPEVEKFRQCERGTPYESSVGDMNGVFYVRAGNGVMFTVLASDGTDWTASGLPGEPWEHVSVSNPTRCPTWEEMCFIKDLFFEPNECVVQFHPAKADYRNFHKTCLHLWHCPSIRFPTPPSVCVAPKL